MTSRQKRGAVALLSWTMFPVYLTSSNTLKTSITKPLAVTGPRQTLMHKYRMGSKIVHMSCQRKKKLSSKTLIQHFRERANH